MIVSCGFFGLIKVIWIGLMGFVSGPPRFEGERPRYGDRDGYRAGPKGPPGEFGGEKGGAPADYQPAFRVILFPDMFLVSASML